MIKEIKKQLLSVQDRKYKDFSSSLLPGIDNVIGVRLPILRKMAKEIIKKDYKTFLSDNDCEYLELIMLKGMVIGLIKEDFNLILNHIENFIPKINCWSVCDSFCSSLKIISSKKNETKIFLEKYFNSKKEYDVRFAFVILLTYFIESDYSYVIKKIKEFNNEAYYAKMAAAWCLSICLVKNYSECIKDIKNSKIHSWVLNKGITKAIESFRLNVQQKDELRKLRFCIMNKVSV